MADTFLLNALGPRLQNAGFITLLLLALSASLVLVDRLIIERFVFRPDHVPCQCRLCEGGVSFTTDTTAPLFGQ